MGFISHKGVFLLYLFDELRPVYAFNGFCLTLIVFNAQILKTLLIYRLFSENRFTIITHGAHALDG